MSTISEIGSPFNLNRTGSLLSDTEAKSSGVLAQEDFLKLLTTQLQNQDPLSPMDNAEFLAQMAQFSTVEGIEQVNQNISTLTTTMAASQVQTAAGLLGKSVLVEGNVVRPDAAGGVHGMAELTQSVGAVTVTYADANTDAVLYQQNLGAQTEGWMAFDWTDVPSDIANSRSQVRVTVTAQTDQGQIAVPTSVFAQVQSALGGPGTPSMTLLLEDYGALDSQEVSAFR